MTQLLMTLIICLLVSSAVAGQEQPSVSTIPVGAPIDTDSAGKGGVVATNSVVRVICPKNNRSGTGFVHKSGRVITVEHVVSDCPETFILSATGARIASSVEKADTESDLALLKLSDPLKVAALPISAHDNFMIGAQVSTWGFPGGYGGRSPLLSAGYISGLQPTRMIGQRTISQWIINAAFNRGNSGGPLIHIETGEVIGVVSSKLDSFSEDIKGALDALNNQKFGFTYTATFPDGSTKKFTEGQVVGMVLEELRNQVQLVIGMAVHVHDLRMFLKAQNIDP